MRLIFFVLLLFISINSAHAVVEIPFYGRANLEKHHISVIVPEMFDGSLSIDLQREENNRYGFTFKTDGIVTPLCHVTTELDGNISLVEDDTESVFFKLMFNSSYTLLNQKPVNSVKGDMELKHQRLFINRISVDDVHLQGIVNIEFPMDFDLSLQLGGVNLEEMIRYVDPSVGPWNAAGYLSGQVHFKGTAQSTQVRGELTGYNGYLGHTDYDNFNMSFKGVYPVLDVTRFTMAQPEGLAFNMNGTLDFTSDIDVVTQMKQLKKSPIVHESDEKIEWVFQRDVYRDEESTAETRYFLRRSDRDGGNDEGGMMGLERRIGF